MAPISVRHWGTNMKLFQPKSRQHFSVVSNSPYNYLSVLFLYPSLESFFAWFRSRLRFIRTRTCVYTHLRIHRNELTHTQLQGHIQSERERQRQRGREMAAGPVRDSLTVTVNLIDHLSNCDRHILYIHIHSNIHMYVCVYVKMEGSVTGGNAT